MDLHSETAKIIYAKDSISDEERGVGKRVNHSIVYGIGKEKLMLYLIESGISEEKTKKRIKQVQEFLKPILDNAKSIKEEFKNCGYIINPYNSVIYPQKEWAVYNNYVQSIAADLVVDKLFIIRKLLSGMKTRFMYQVYDSFIFDVHPDELFFIEKIKSTLEKSGSYRFEVECVTGKNLMECTSQKETEEINIVD